MGQTQHGIKYSLGLLPECSASFRGFGDVISILYFESAWVLKRKKVIVTAVYNVRETVDLDGGLSLCEGYECLIVIFSTPETNIIKKCTTTK